MSVGNIGLETDVFEEAPPQDQESQGQESEGSGAIEDPSFARQNGTHPENHFPEVPFRDTSGKLAKAPLLSQVIE